jgi:hypothetical protein
MVPRGQMGPQWGKTIFTCVYVGKIFLNLLLKNHWARKAEIYMKAF